MSGAESKGFAEVDFSESNLDGVYACKNCGWPCTDDHSRPYTPFHLMGRWGETSKCEKAEPDRNKPWRKQ